MCALPLYLNGVDCWLIAFGFDCDALGWLLVCCLVGLVCLIGCYFGLDYCYLHWFRLLWFLILLLICCWWFISLSYCCCCVSLCLGVWLLLLVYCLYNNGLVFICVFGMLLYELFGWGMVVFCFV